MSHIPQYLLDAVLQRFLLLEHVADVPPGHQCEGLADDVGNVLRGADDRLALVRGVTYAQQQSRRLLDAILQGFLLTVHVEDVRALRQLERLAKDLGQVMGRVDDRLALVRRITHAQQQSRRLHDAILQDFLLTVHVEDARAHHELQPPTEDFGHVMGRVDDRLALVRRINHVQHHSRRQLDAVLQHFLLPLHEHERLVEDLAHVLGRGHVLPITFDAL